MRTRTGDGLLWPEQMEPRGWWKISCLAFELETWGENADFTGLLFPRDMDGLVTKLPGVPLIRLGHLDNNHLSRRRMPPPLML